MREEDVTPPFTLALVLMWAFMFCAWCYGVFLSFSAGVAVGLIALLVQPVPLIVGLTKILTGTNLAEIFVNFAGL